MFINLTDKQIEQLAEEMRNRHYTTYIGREPTLPFSLLVGERKLKWLDQVKVAIELLTPYIAK
jgi:hypothetical protein